MLLLATLLIAQTGLDGGIAWDSLSGVDGVVYDPVPWVKSNWCLGTSLQTGDGTLTPSTATRASTATKLVYQGGDYKVVSAATNEIRTGLAGAGDTERCGVLIEESRLNDILNSGDMTAATWNDSNMTTSASALAAPYASENWSEQVGSAATAQHETFSGGRSCPGGTSTQHTWSTWVISDKGAQPWVAILASIGGGGGSTFRQWFRKSDCSVGTNTLAAVDEAYGIGPFEANGESVCILVVVATTTGTAGSCNISILPAEADADLQYLGDGSTVDNYAWGSQLEVGVGHTSYIPTAGAQVTRAADSLIYNANNVTGLTAPGAVLMSVFAISDVANSDQAFIDTTSGAPAQGFLLETTSDALVFTVSTNGTTTSASDAGALNGTNWVWADIAGDWADGDSGVWLNGVEGATDTPAAPTGDFGSIYIGADNGGANFANTWLGDIRIYDEARTPK